MHKIHITILSGFMHHWFPRCSKGLIFLYIYLNEWKCLFFLKKLGSSISGLYWCKTHPLLLECEEVHFYSCNVKVDFFSMERTVFSPSLLLPMYCMYSFILYIGYEAHNAIHCHGFSSCWLVGWLVNVLNRNIKFRTTFH